MRFTRADATYGTGPAPGLIGALHKEDDILSQTTEAATGMAVPDSGTARIPDSYTSDELLARILSSLDDDKAEDVVSIDLRGKSEIADYMVICSGRSSRQVASISEKLTDRLKHEFSIISRVEGQEQGDWVLIDAGDVIIHVFRPEVREFYQLEKMWMGPGPARG